jgi:hypothetical protein
MCPLTATLPDDDPVEEAIDAPTIVVEALPAIDPIAVSVVWSIPETVP